MVCQVIEEEDEFANDEAARWLAEEEQRLEYSTLKEGVNAGFSVYVRKEWQTLFGPHWEGWEASPIQYARGIYGRFGKAQQAAKMLMEGKPIREVSRLTGISKNTGKRIKNILQVATGMRFECPCGQPSGHQGWCKYRFANSEARQETMRRMRR